MRSKKQKLDFAGYAKMRDPQLSIERRLKSITADGRLHKLLVLSRDGLANFQFIIDHAKDSGIPVLVDSINAPSDFHRRRSTTWNVGDGALCRSLKGDGSIRSRAICECVLIDCRRHHIGNSNFDKLPQKIMSGSVLPFDVAGRFLDGALDAPINRIVGDRQLRPAGRHQQLVAPS